jgi:tetratricopeptide (TPR) repeat protein
MGTKPFAPPRRISSGTELLQRAAEDRRLGASPIRETRPDLPAALEAVIQRCLAPNPDDRYASAADLALDLQAVADDRPLKVAREPIVHRLYRATRRNRRTLIAAVPVVLAAAVISTLLVREKKNADARMASYEHQRELAGNAYKAGLKSEHDEDSKQAVSHFTSAETLANYAEPGWLTRALTGSRGQSDTELTLAELKSLAHRHLVVAERAEAVRQMAREFFDAAVPLRFLLTGFGRDVSSASHSVMQAIEPLKILGEENWTTYPDLTLLVEGQKEQLEREVNDVLFLWVVLLENSSGSDDLQLASQICTKAMRFVKPDGPWRALQARVERRPAPGPRPDDERSALACFQWGMLADLDENRTDEAISWYRKAADGDSDNYWYHYYLAFAYDKHPNGVEPALRQYEAALARNKNSPWVRFCRARLNRRRQNFGEAKKEFERALSDFHKLGDAARYPEFELMYRLEMGNIRQSLGDLAGARADFEWVIAADSTSRYAYAARLNSAHVDAARGEYARALETYDRLIADDPDDVPARRGRALTLMLQWRTREAEEGLTHLLDGGKADRLVALPERAYARLVQGRPAEALADIDEAISLVPKPSAKLDRLRTRILLALGRVDDLVLTRPEDIDALPGQGAPLRADLLRVADKLSSKERKDRSDPSSLYRALLTRAVVLSAMGGRAHFAEAENAASRAIELAKLSAQPYLTRALVRHRAGDRAGADADVELALARDPKSPIALELRGVLKTEAGDAAGGLTDLNSAADLAPRGRVRTAMARALMALNQPEKALSQWSAAIAFDDEDPAAYLGRAEAFLALKKDDQAVADLERATVYWVEGRPTFGLRLAWTYARCLGARPYLFPRLVALGRRTLASLSSGEAAGPSTMRPL